jgi:hypothetical protein
MCNKRDKSITKGKEKMVGAEKNEYFTTADCDRYKTNKDRNAEEGRMEV